MSTKKSENISWDCYFMALAILISLRSKDPNSKVGAVLVNDKKVIGTGYNGFPSGCDETKFSWERDSKGEWLDTKYPYVIHAEANALLNTVASPKGSTLYATMHPCNECAKLIIQSGIKKIIFLDDKYPDDKIFVAAKKLFTVTGIEIEQIKIAEIDFDKIIKIFINYAARSTDIKKLIADL